MKKMILLGLALCLTLVACASKPPIDNTARDERAREEAQRANQELGK